MGLLAEEIGRAVELMLERRPTAVLTGAGVSVESGIPDFRSPGGLWERFDPMEYATIEGFIGDPEKVWTMLFELGETVVLAAPNAGHEALARLETLGVVGAVITQNIDNLHQRAGSRRVVEFHGNATRLSCLECGTRVGSYDEPRQKRAPRCPACDAILKPDVVFFGEAIPAEVLREATELATSCGVMLVAGTSATVAPASSLPVLARRAGASIIEVNPERTPVTDISEVSLHGPAGLVLPALADEVGRRLGA